MALVEVLRPFMVGGERVEIGAVVDLAPSIANLVIEAKKAKPALAPAPEPEPTPEPKPAPKRQAHKPHPTPASTEDD